MTHCCRWCREPFEKFGKRSFYEGQKYCCSECGFEFRRMRQRILTKYPFDDDKHRVELAKLSELGNRYKLPPREVD